MGKDNNKGVITFSPAEKAIYTTILYSDIFSFPLTKEEIWNWLISEEKIARVLFERALQNLQNQVTYKEGYYCLQGREAIIRKRIKNFPEVAKKREIAQQAAQKLSKISSILFIGISGGLAAGNVLPADDIDFVIIVKKDTLFVTRLLVLGVLESLGIRRSRNQKNTANTICVNLLFDETALSWFAKPQNLYVARELSQVIPLFERGNIYKQFYEANKWIYKFLPNGGMFASVAKEKRRERGKDNYFIFNSFTETICRYIQMSLMKRYHTREVLSKHLLAFHPIDYETKTLNELRLKLQQFGLLTNF